MYAMDVVRDRPDQSPPGQQQICSNIRGQMHNFSRDYDPSEQNDPERRHNKNSLGTLHPNTNMRRPRPPPLKSPQPMSQAREPEGIVTNVE